MKKKFSLICGTLDDAGGANCNGVPEGWKKNGGHPVKNPGGGTINICVSG